MQPLTLEQMRALLPQMPFNHHLGLRITRRHADGLTMELDVRPTLFNLLGGLHGGVTATLIDAAIGIAVFGHYGGRRATTVELKVNYHRPVSSGLVRARARIVKPGRRLVFGTAEVTGAGRQLIASGSATYMLL